MKVSQIWRLYRACFTRRTVLMIFLLLFGWSMVMLNMNTVQRMHDKDSEYLKAEIIKLSEDYIQALARENEGIIDGPYAGRFTAYDLKKTMAILLESVLERLGRLESQLANLTLRENLTVTTRNAPQNVNRSQVLAEDLVLGNIPECVLNNADKKDFPDCTGKLVWMEKMWKSDACYASYGVDGSQCSFLMYLSEVEGWCPTRAWRKSGAHLLVSKVSQTAIVNTNVTRLMNILADPNERHAYSWMRIRITRMWPKWLRAAERLSEQLKNRPRRKILIHLGLLTNVSGWKFAEMAFKGGPLGELVQWSDLISTLYILGHELTITSEVEQLTSILKQLPSAASACQSRKELPVDIIYTDLIGMKQFKKSVKNGYAKFSCLLRIVDSFGTEAAYNHRDFAREKKQLTPWGGQDLNLQQFFTMFPHSPDNSFMGFVVEQYLNNTIAASVKRKNQSLVYGKNDYMWKNKINFIKMVKKYLDVHGTVYLEGEAKNVPAYVKNHGLLNGEELHHLLRETKIFVGLGFPYEGPAPLEAIANGAVFINPSFNPPHSSLNTKFFKGKPTARNVTSQHPYAERYIGEPHVYTIDVDNMEKVEATIQYILNKNMFQPYLPYEFTEEGMLQRMNAYIEHQNFCSFQKKVPKWPPKSAIKVLIGEEGKSCTQVCMSNNLTCERSHFESLNSMSEIISHGGGCMGGEDRHRDIYPPAVNVVTRQCVLQTEPLLFSCAGGQLPYQRVCPCRNFIKNQTALCQECL